MAVVSDIVLYQTPETVLPKLPARDIPRDVAQAPKCTVEALKSMRSPFWRRAAAFRAKTRSRIKVGSEELIRQDRDER